MEHSDCYSVKAPAGPAGENLFKASYKGTPLEAVSAWYSEIADCGPFPGCSEGAAGTVGHFTALIWNGDKQIGCAFGQDGLVACRYKAQDFKSCETPNYGGKESYPANIFPKVKDFSACVDAVKACGFADTFTTAPHATLDAVLGYSATKAEIGAELESELEGAVETVEQVGRSPIGLVAVAAVIGALTLSARLQVKRAEGARTAREMALDDELIECE
jgi:hypothetical protein